MPILFFENLGVSEIAFMAFGLFMMILFFVLVFFGLRYIKNNPENNGEKKKCPFCAELIQKEAIVCRYCKRDLVK